MQNLFSIFDPHAFLGMAVNWLALMFTLFLLPALFWASKNQASQTVCALKTFIYSEFYAVFNPNPPGSILILFSLFVFIALNNVLGLLPYIFTSTSHLSITVALALPLWVGHMGIACLKTTNNVLSHLVPLGTPGPLMAFMVIIELISSIIRPLTLSVRLAANMIAGHLLLALLSGLGSPTELSLSLLIIACLIPLIVLETAVALIQSYVFSVLSTLYVAEVASPRL